MLAVFAMAAIQVTAQWESMTPMPTARAMATSCELDGKIYVIGGIFSDTSPATAKVERYDPVLDEWDTTVPDLPAPLCGASASVVNGKIYVIGGRESYSGTPHKSVYIYDPAMGGWTSGKDDITGPRSWIATSVLGDKIYAMGGYGYWGDGTTKDTVSVYDPAINDWTFTESMLSPRQGLTSDVVDGKIYTTGGMQEGIPHAVVESYDGISWSAKTSMPGPKFWHGSGVVDEQIYVFGGLKTEASETPDHARDTWRYDPATDHWTNIGVNLPESISGYGYATAEDAGGNECFYTFGGGYGDWAITDAVFKFCPPKEEDTKWEYQEVMPTPRAFTASCELDDKIYVIGGTFSIDSDATTKVEAYDWATDTWDTDKADLPVGLCDASAEVVGGKIYVIGGRPKYLETAYDSVFVYDPVADEWTSLHDTAAKKAGYASAMVDASIFVMGGGGPTDEVVAYNPATGDWTPKTNMPISSRVWHTAEVSGGKIYSMGGIALGEAKTLVQEYDPASDMWTSKADMPDTKFLHGSAACTLDNSIYVFGGAASLDASSQGLWRYDLSDGFWYDTEDDMPEMMGAFADAIVEVSDNEQCIYAIGGTRPDFWVNGPGELVGGEVYKYCITVNSSKEVADASAPVVLSQNFPNPFSSSTTIIYELRNAGEVNLKVFNLAGKELATVFDGHQPAGLHTVEWNADELPSGVYFYRLQTPAQTVTKRCVRQR